MRVNTGASVAMFDLSRVAEIMSMSVESLLVPFVTRLQMSLHVTSLKSQRGSTKDSHYHLRTPTAGAAYL